jgi:hypothetical protein
MALTTQKDAKVPWQSRRPGVGVTLDGVKSPPGMLVPSTTAAVSLMIP